MTAPVVALAGGVGGAKLSEGLAAHLGSALSVVVNTADDCERHGLLVMPDHDTVMYNLAGIEQAGLGWGIEGDTHAAMEQLAAYGEPAWFSLGDRDLALHIARTARLRAGGRLTQVCLGLQASLGLTARILPMSDASVRTQVRTDDGWLEFQEYFVHRRQEPDVREVRFVGIDGAAPTPAPTPEVPAALGQAATPTPEVPAALGQAATPTPEVLAALGQAAAPTPEVPAALGQAAAPTPEVVAALRQAAAPTPEVLAALGQAAAIVLCPSNPVVSIGPILALPGLRGAVAEARVRGARVVAVSPIVGGRALKGPADRMLASLGHEPTALGVARLYADLADVFVLDRLDAALAPGVEALGMRPLVTDTVMGDDASRARLARTVLEAAGIATS